MRHFILPKKLKMGDRIIIYGLGEVGRSYLVQAEHYGINVVMIADGLANVFAKRIHSILPVMPEELKNVSSDLYDYVVVAIADKSSNERIIEMLGKFGIPKEKIISAVDYYDDAVTVDTPEVKNSSFAYFSWHGEDIIISNIFSRMSIENPTYLDVGCNEPYRGNNTALFYLTGSKGVCIDANAEMIKNIELKRPDDTALCMGIVPSGKDGEKCTFFIACESGLSTFDRKHIDDYAQEHLLTYDDNIKNTVSVKTYSLSYVVNTYCNGVWPDLLDLDVEGLDDEIMKNTSFAENGPKVICVESHLKETREKMKKDGYFLYTYTDLNDIYVRNEYRDILIIS